MPGKIKLVLNEKNNIVELVEKETDTVPLALLKSLEEFRTMVNEVFTKKIENDGLLDDFIESDLSHDSDVEDEPAQPISPKKRKM